MKQIKGIFQVTSEADKNKLSGEVTTLLLSLSDTRFNEHLLVESSDQAFLYYYAGHISRSLLKSMPNTCFACKDLLTSRFAENEIESKDADCYDNTSAKDEFISIVTRGRLLKPSDIVYITSVHVWAMYCHIRDDDVCKNILMSSSNPRNVFCATFVEKLHDENETNAILTSSCVNQTLLVICLKIFLTE